MEACWLFVGHSLFSLFPVVVSCLKGTWVPWWMWSSWSGGLLVHKVDEVAANWKSLPLWSLIWWLFRNTRWVFQDHVNGVIKAFSKSMGKGLAIGAEVLALLEGSTWLLDWDLQYSSGSDSTIVNFWVYERESWLHKIFNLYKIFKPGWPK